MTSPSLTTLPVQARPGAPALLAVTADGAPSGWAAANRDALRAAVTEHGAVVVRGLGLTDAAAVSGVFTALADELMSDEEAFAARRRYAPGVYSSAAWPDAQPMCMHHELSYRRLVPGLAMFACLTAPTSGGATGVADAFGTDSRSAVDAYCQRNAIEQQWRPDGSLSTRQRRPAVITHPGTGRRAWVNQVAFLSEWTIEPEIREFLVEMYGPEGLPFTTAYGDGTPIEAEVIELLNEVYEAHTRRDPWQAGDLLLVDNLGTAHSREAFEGSREVLVGLAEPTDLSALTSGGAR